MSGGDNKGVKPNFGKANLTGANLSEADLHCTIFHQTILEQTVFEMTHLWHTIFSDVDLSKSIDLRKAHHAGPSTLGIETIINSKDKIPYVFLRGCGIPEIFIQYMSSLTMIPIEYYSCFISYSHEDNSFARRLHDQLSGLVNPPE